jgi:cytoskeletal protein RodZ
MSKLGSTLKNKRETLRISIDKVTEDTRISADVVAVLEEGRYKEMPSYNHAKNFVKNYAEYLKLDYENIYDLFIEECSKEDFSRDISYVASPVSQEEPEEKAAASSAGVKYIIPILLIVVIAFAGGKVFMSMKKKPDVEKKTEVVAETPEKEEVVLDEPVDKQEEVKEAIEKIKKETDEDSAQQEVAPVEKVENKPAPVVEEPEQKSAVEPEKEVSEADDTASYAAFVPDQKDEPASEAKTAVINFADVCWVHIKIDGKEEMDFIAERGTKRDITFHDDFIIDIGNAAVVSISYNGRTIAGLGAYKQPVKGLKFKVNDKNRLTYSK